MTTATKMAATTSTNNKTLEVFYHPRGKAVSDFECEERARRIAETISSGTVSDDQWGIVVSTENILLAIRAAVAAGLYSGITVTFIEGSPVDYDAVRCEVDGEGRMLPVAVPQNGLTKRMLDSMLYKGGANVSKS